MSFGFPESLPPSYETSFSPSSTQTPLVSKLEEAIKMKEILQIAQSSEGPFQENELIQLRQLSPGPSYKTREAWIEFANKHLKSLGAEIHASQETLAGHGGTLTGEIKIDGKTHYLFLKPLDPAEALNYKIIQQQCPELAQWMPQVYGEITIGEKRYMVMNNTRKSEEGADLRQLEDIKLAGKVAGLNNPIAHPKEVEVAHEKPKKVSSFVAMQLGALMAPNYMIARGSNGFVDLLTGNFRLANYRSSKENLQNSLLSLSHTCKAEQLIHLATQLQELQTALENSPIALIGASIILVEDREGNIRPILIDPAHMQIDPSKEKTIKEGLSENEKRRVYVGERVDFLLQRESNKKSMGCLITDVVAGRAMQVATVKIEPPPSPSPKKRSFMPLQGNLLKRLGWSVQESKYGRNPLLSIGDEGRAI